MYTFKPFRFWCQKVLPLVYDDSLSYYELLCKLVKYLNDALAELERMGTDLTNLQALFIELKQYVDGYFDSADFQGMIEDKLDEMAEGGTFDSIFNTFIQSQDFADAQTNLKNDIIDDVTDMILASEIFVSPMDYGAVGDGATDDSVAIQNASTHGIVCDLDHTFYIASPVTLTNGAFKTKFYMQKDAYIQNNGKYFIGNECYRNVSELNDGTRGQWMVIVRSVDGCYIANNNFHDCVSAVYVGESSNVIVCNNSFHDIIQTAVGSGGNGYGVLFAGVINGKIYGNNFVDVARHSIYLSVDDSNPIKNTFIDIFDNMFRHISPVGSTTGFEVSIFVRPSSCVRIHDNTFYGVESCVSFNTQTLGSDTTIVGSENCEFADNTVIRCLNSVRPSDGCVNVIGDVSGVTGCKNIVIKHNTLIGCAYHLVRLDSSNNAIIEGNIMLNNGVSRRNDIYCPSQTNTSHINGVVIKDNYNDGNITSAWFRIEGSVDEGYNLGDLTIIGNHVKGTAILFFDNFLRFNNFVINDNVFVTTQEYGGSGLYYNSLIAKNNSCNIWKLSATHDNAKILAYDSSVGGLTDVTDLDAQIGNIICTSDGNVYAVNSNKVCVQI